MKKTIKILAEKMDKLQEKKDGTLQGGFASIRGGVMEPILAQIQRCVQMTLLVVALPQIREPLPAVIVGRALYNLCVVINILFFTHLNF